MGQGLGQQHRLQAKECRDAAHEGDSGRARAMPRHRERDRARHENRQQPRLCHGDEREADASGDERPSDLDARTRQDVERDVTETAEPRGGEQVKYRAVADECATAISAAEPAIGRLPASECVPTSWARR